MSASVPDSLTSWHADWSGLTVAVLGAGVTGFSVADTLAELGARVTVFAERSSPEREPLLEVIGARFVVSDLTGGVPAELEDLHPDLVVVSPGFRPDTPALVWAEGRGIPVWGDVELAWRVRDKAGEPAEWILVTGTNGKTTTTRLTAAMLVSGGLRAAPCGNIGVPVLDAIRDPQGFDVLVVELSSYQLHWLNRGGPGDLVPLSSVCLNIADDHLDWHGSLDAYAEAKSAVYANTRVACVYNRADARTEQMVRDAEVTEGARAIGFGLGVPGPSDLGVVDGILCDRAFLDDRAHSALELTTLEELARVGLAAPHLVADVLAAAALARSAGVSPAAIAGALAVFELDEHRIQTVAVHAGVSWVDDSKATNPHAADASLRSFPTVVWIVGGLLKGVVIDDLVARHVARLKGVVVIGEDRVAVVDAFARHAPAVPVREVSTAETERVMDEAVALAAGLAEAGDTVLLAPSAASMDQFADYGDRGRRFAASVREHVRSATDDGRPSDER